MPDLPNRERFEQELERQLTRAFRSARKELQDLLWREGMVYRDLAAVPRTTWDILRVDVRRIFEDTLVDAYMEAAKTFADALTYAIHEPELRIDAEAWAQQYAMIAAESLISASQRMLSRIADRSPELPLSKKILASILAAILSASRAAINARTEVTNAASAGETSIEGALIRDGANVEAVWFTQLDERVCPVCAPRHGKVQGEGWLTPPPAHPNCRCYKGYRIKTGNTQVILFDDEAVARELRKRP